MTEVKVGPSVHTSKKTIIYKESDWKIHRFSIWSGEALADVEVLRMLNSLLLWVGKASKPDLTEFALGMPGQEGKEGLSTSLIGPPTANYSAQLAARLAAVLHKPVYVSCNVIMDRFTTPLIEKGLMMEIKSHREFF